jgi:hypothetical protein
LLNGSEIILLVSLYHTHVYEYCKKVDGYLGAYGRQERNGSIKYFNDEVGIESITGDSTRTGPRVRGVLTHIKFRSPGARSLALPMVGPGAHLRHSPAYRHAGCGAYLFLERLGAITHSWIQQCQEQGRSFVLVPGPGQYTRGRCRLFVGEKGGNHIQGTSPDCLHADYHGYSSLLGRPERCEENRGEHHYLGGRFVDRHISSPGNYPRGIPVGCYYDNRADDRVDQKGCSQIFIPVVHAHYLGRSPGKTAIHDFKPNGNNHELYRGDAGLFYYRYCEYRVFTSLHCYKGFSALCLVQVCIGGTYYRGCLDTIHEMNNH